MGLIFPRPRRLLCLAAGAATAGVAYNAGERPMRPAKYSPPPPAVVRGAGVADDLDHLVALRATGVLNDAEFTVAKARLPEM